MVKLNIHNMDDFLQVLNKCNNDVFIIQPDGHKSIINQNDNVQRTLQKNYYENNKYLSIWLDISNYRDYLNIIFYHISNI